MKYLKQKKYLITNKRLELTLVKLKMQEHYMSPHTYKAHTRTRKPLMQPQCY
jgi:hypothetical protein